MRSLLSNAVAGSGILVAGVSGDEGQEEKWALHPI